jgi:hypothetical protein
MTAEVEQARPLIRYASRQWELLDEEFRKRLLIIYKVMREKHGYEMVLLEGYRSPERQAQLAGLGRHVTERAPIRAITNSGSPPTAPSAATAASSFAKPTPGRCAATSSTARWRARSAWSGAAAGA